MRWTPGRKLTVAVIIIAAIIAVAVLILRRPADTAPQYAFESVRRGTIEDIVTESGNVRSAGQAAVAAPIAGVVDEIYVANGTRVSRGQKLFQIRSTASAADRAAAYASYQGAVSSLSSAEQNKLTLKYQLETAREQLYNTRAALNVLNYNISRNLPNPATRKVYTEAEQAGAKQAVESAEANVAAAERGYREADTVIEAARAARDSADLTYQATQSAIARAPRAGTVANISVTVGDKVSDEPALAAAVSVSGQEPPPMIVANLDDLNVVIAVNEVDYHKLAIGQRARIIFDAVTDREFSGQLVKMDTVGTNSQNVITYDAYFQLDDPVSEIRPEMTANVSIEIVRHEDALIVSNGALKPYQGGKAVQLVRPEAKSKPGGLTEADLEYQPVKIGIRGATETEITEGIVEGAEVVLSVESAGTTQRGLFRRGD